MGSRFVKVLVVAACLLFPSTAFAKKGIPFIYNTGQEAFETGPLPPPYDQHPQLQGYTAGYLCDIKGVLWSYFSVSNCKPVAFKDDTFVDDPELAAAVKAKYPESAMQRGVWGQFGWMGLALVVVAGLALWAKEFFTGKGDSASEGEESETKSAE